MKKHTREMKKETRQKGKERKKEKERIFLMLSVRSRVVCVKGRRREKGEVTWLWMPLCSVL